MGHPGGDEEEMKRRRRRHGGRKGRAGGRSASAAASRASVASVAASASALVLLAAAAASGVPFVSAGSNTQGGGGGGGGGETPPEETDNLAPPLTSDETALLAELSSGGSVLPPSLTDFASSLSARIESAAEAQERGTELLAKAEELGRRRDALLERTAELEADVRRRNAGELRKLWGRINATMGEELRRRDRMDEVRREAEEEAERARAAIADAALEREAELEEKDDEEEKEEKGEKKPPTVTVEELERALDRDSILGPSESELEEWVADLAREELEAHSRDERDRIEERRRAREERSKCVDPLSAGALVRDDLVRHAADGVGRYDHAAAENGGSVVYADGMTSDPYDPRDDLGRVRVGEVWWRRYVPEDWEAFLPYGWERWTVPAEGWRGYVPSYVWTSLGLKSSPVQPPESALTPNTHVGSCYPLPGRSGGRLTVRLPHPVSVDAVTVDHVPSVLGGERGRSSAVRYFKVVGYPPCDERGGAAEEEEEEYDERKEREECERVGFDARRSVEMGEYEYRIVTSKLDREGNAPGGRSVQTFDVTEALERAAAAAQEDEEGDEDEDESEDEDEEDEDEDEGDPGMCTIEKAASCGGPGGGKKKKKKKLFQAVTIEVEDNWGTEEYTCLYRFRVHGEKVGA